MFDRFKITPVVEKHLWSMRPPGSQRMRRSDRLVYAGVPMLTSVVAGAAIWLGAPVSNGISQLLAATSLLVGAMLTTFVFLVNLRIRVGDSKSTVYRRNLQRLIGSAVASSLYSAAVAAFLTFLLAVVATFDDLRAPVVAPFTAGVVAGVAAHLGITLLTVIRRLFGVYVDVFGADYGPELVQSEDRTKRSSAG
ncbi:hypothetical protein [Cellulomonas sp. ES6]|uniref:hypothetical protein n=1 Tax=Cellulomonas sp. ES6 TaxID=3039384 RepID=UPI0024B63A75|nr:hypothetical protein [Cellulomonas sp. ES6]WHP18803.1 hypothetical protein P9841_06720 [Cellulomonas sp. ES6]